ncbi:MAG: class I SAM-dependent methyltransferase [Bacteroidetes bacterium]|nr:class I SAM-dependent methyltransferase [Bacteroidota bacterium]
MEDLDLIHSKTRDAYNLAADKYHNLFHNEMSEKEFDRSLLDNFAGKLPKGSLICDAGCGPSAHIGRYLFDKGIDVIGVDISDRCIELASTLNPEMKFKCNDMAKMDFESNYFDAVISYYSIIHTPKSFVNKLFNEFYRILKPNGYLLLAVKIGTEEGIQSQLIGIDTEIYFSLFTLKEIMDYFKNAGFDLDFIEKRNPYDFEIKNERIFAIGQKLMI